MKKIRFVICSILLSSSLCSSAQSTIVDSFIVEGIYRSYRLYIPASYTGTTAWPLILNLHGYSSNASDQQIYSNFQPIADTANFLMVYPQGTDYMGQPYWNAGLFAGGVNDVLFLSELIDTISANYNVDASSVYSCGMSNGGYMSHTLACELNSKITAIASVTGSMFSTQKDSCFPSRAVPVMQIHGTADPTVSYNGSLGSLPIDTLVKYWVDHNYCNPIPQFNNVPNTSTTDGCTAEHYVYSGGSQGASVELYKIINGGHTWPGSPYIIGTTNQDFNASNEIWLFFRKYKLSMFVSVPEVSTAVPIEFFPNPSSSLITVNYEDPCTVNIFDMNGRLVLSSRNKTIDISALSSGIYSINMESRQGRSIRKLVKL